jgi:hypothetical protein
MRKTRKKTRGIALTLTLSHRMGEGTAMRGCGKFGKPPTGRRRYGWRSQDEGQSSQAPEPSRVAAHIARHLGGGEWLGVVVGICTIALGAISLWIAFALLVNPVAGRAAFALPGPVCRPRSAR